MLDRRGSGIGGRVLEGSNRSRLLNLWGSLVDLGGVADLPGPRLEKLADTSGQTAANLEGRPGDLLLFLFLLLFLLLGLLGFRDRSLFDGSGFGLLDRLRGRLNSLNGRLRSGGLLRLDISRGGLLSGSDGFLGGRSRRLK